MLSEGHKMNIVYFDPYPNKFLEEYIRDYSKLLESKGEPGVSIRKLDTVEDVLKEADVGLLMLQTVPPSLVLYKASQEHAIGNKELYTDQSTNSLNLERVAHLNSESCVHLGSMRPVSTPLLKTQIRKCNQSSQRA